MTGVLFRCDTTSDKHTGLLHNSLSSGGLHTLVAAMPLCPLVLTCVSVAWFAWCGKGLTPFSCLPHFCCYKKTRPDGCRHPLHCPVTSLVKVRKHFSLALFVIVFSHCCDQDCCSGMDTTWRDLCSFTNTKTLTIFSICGNTLIVKTCVMPLNQTRPK